MNRTKKTQSPARGKKQSTKAKKSGKAAQQMPAMVHTSFADMLKENVEIRRILKLPPWLSFLLPYARKGQASLTALEQNRFLCAFNTINSNGTLGQLVDIHGDPSHQMHHTLRFLPWHRIFLLKFEQALRSIHP